jgi:hypothetical protein
MSARRSACERSVRLRGGARGRCARRTPRHSAAPYRLLRPAPVPGGSRCPRSSAANCSASWAAVSGSSPAWALSSAARTSSRAEGRGPRRPTGAWGRGSGLRPAGRLAEPGGHRGSSGRSRGGCRVVAGPAR